MDSKNTHDHSAGCGCCMSKSCGDLNRREFVTGVGMGLAAGSFALSSLAKMSMGATADSNFVPAKALRLRVQPVLTAAVPQRRPQTSWRNWGGFQKQEDIENEKQRIKRELDKLESESEFGMDILPLVTLNDAGQAAQVAKGDHDVLLLYAATSGLDVLEKLTDPQKWTIMFVRHKSGPVYLWYEIAHNRYLRKTVDEYGQAGMDHQDVVVDNMEEMKWRLRSLYGLKNAMGKKVVAVGGPSGWGVGGRKAPELTRNQWKMDLQTVDYKLLGEMIKKARQNTALVKRCEQEAKNYIKQKGISLDTDMKFVNNGFLLTEVFKSLLDEAKTDAFTINNCMGTIMGVAETTACLPLSLLNDSGYTAFCESDFVVIPSGILLHHISSLPVFLNDPTYPHEGVVTLAHCTAPRMMDGKKCEPAKILTHFESDYGAAPKVEMKVGQKITVIDPDFDGKVWLGFEGEILDNPFLDICRSQIDVKINGDCDELVAKTKGFHWMVSYDNYLKEVGYALKKVGIKWDNLSV
ncbi:MAG: hypothetical protein JXD22_08595 [Sedimentisphaerales bacterium]|nr:hypothetical protein [Sedimentisphaerales bacterium]